MATENTLFMLLGAQFALYACAWWCYARFVAEDRSATTIWGVFNILIGIGMLLTLMRNADRDWLAVVGADIAFVFAFTCAWRGVAAFAHIPQQNRLQVVIATVTTLILVVLGPGTEVAPLRVALTYSASALCIVIAIKQCGPALRAEFEWQRSRFLRLATLTAAIILLLAAAQQLFQPSSLFELNTNTVSNSVLLVMLLLIAGTFNFSCLALQLLRYLKQLRNLTHKDPLTGLHNRRAFDDHTASIWENFQSSDMPVTVSVLDLDHFKDVNDKYGHASGDEVLKQIAKMMVGNARDRDIIARFGGEEFVIVMPQTSLNEASVMLERLRHMLETTPITVNSTQTLTVTCSIGLTELDREDTDFHQAVTRADDYMYNAKRQGRNRLCLSDSFSNSIPIH